MQLLNKNFHRSLGQKLLLTIALMSASFAHAQTTTEGAVTLRSYSNYFYTTEQPDATTINIFAGNTNSPCLSTSATSTCDSCEGWTDAIQDIYANQVAPGGSTFQGLMCNKQQIHTNLQFSVTLASSKITSNSTCTTPLLGLIGTTPLATQVNRNNGDGTATIAWTWGEICGRSSNSNSCLESFSGKPILVGLNKDCAGATHDGTPFKFKVAMRYVGWANPMVFGCGSQMQPYEGFCDFTVYPGDEKVYLYDLAANTENSFVTGNQISSANATAADASNVKFKALRVFRGNGGTFAGIKPGSPSVDLTAEGTTIKDRKITGLNNDQAYAFLVANVDQAGNTYLFSDPNDVGVSAPMDPTAALGTTQGAKPEKVYGLLDGKSCFIATAAYGSEDALDVERLRQFRNSYLLTWEGGRKFVRLYYKISPPIADFIAKNETLKWSVRQLLKPFVLLADVMLGSKEQK